MIGVSPDLAKMEKAWIVSCKLPSPVTRINRLNGTCDSFPAMEAPTAAPVAKPMLPNTDCVNILTPEGKYVSVIPA